MTVLATVLHCALPPLSILALGRFAPRRGFVWMVVAGVALYESLLLFFGLLLGYAGGLRSPWPLRLWSLVAALLAVFAARGAVPAWKAARSALAGVRPRPADALVGVAALVTVYLVGLQIGRDWTAGTVNFDSLAYHIPRALFWSWQGDFRPWPAPEWQQLGLPIGADVLLLPGVFLGLGWLGGSWTTAWLAFGAAAAVFAACRGLGAGRRSSLVGALAFLSFPAVGLRLADVNSDMAAAFPLLAAWVLSDRAGSIAEEAFLFPALCGVGVASKANVAPAVLVLAIARFGNRLRALRDRRVLAAAVAGTVLAALFCAGSYLPVRRLFGDLMGGSEGHTLASYLSGPPAVARATLFGALHWLVEPFALVSEPPRFDVLDRLGLARAYHALGAGARELWYPTLDAVTNMSGVFPFLALPWLIAALPRGRRLRGGLLFLALLLALLAPLNPNCYASRFTIVLLAAFAVLWGLRAGRSLWLVAVLLLAALAADARVLQWRILPEFHAPRARNARIAAAVGPRTLWLLSGSIGADAHIAGLHANVRFEYVQCPRDGDWTRYFTEIRKTSPWLLLNNNGPKVATGPGSFSAFGPPCPEVFVAELQQALTAAGWHVAFEEFGYQVWSAEQGREGA